MSRSEEERIVRETVSRLVASREAVTAPALHALADLVEGVTDERLAALTARSKAELLSIVTDVVVRAESIRVAIVLAADQEVPS